MNALLVGQRFFDDQTLAIQLRCWGFRCDFANNVTDARRILKSNQHDLILSLALLPDGIGIELTKASETRPGTTFVCLELDDICIWMAASDSGRECMRKAALSTSEFTRMLEELSKQLAAPSSAKSPNRELRIVPSPHHRPCGRRNRERSDQPSSSVALVEVISD
jgi:DNA-binding NtrC family response regulator